MNDTKTIRLIDRVACTGCGLCRDICPTKAIDLNYCNETTWFLYPIIDENKCIKCGSCFRSCPSKFKSFIGFQEAFILRDTRAQNRFLSSSGGAFGLISDAFFNLHEKCAVFGVEWDSNLNPVYTFAVKREQLNKFQKSKYVQAETTGIFIKVRQLISEGYYILFFGTPCVCNALSYLSKKEKDSLVLVDIVCHGVPSIKMWNKYKAEKGNKINMYSFRNKRPVAGIVDSTTAIYSSGKKEKIISYHNDGWLRSYYDRISYRDSCYNCKYANLNRVGDITIGDAWHIEKLYKDLDSNDGVSMLLVNSKKGKELFDTLSNCDCRPIDIEFLKNNNEALSSATVMPETRSIFLLSLDSLKYESAAFKYSCSSRARLLKHLPTGLILRIKKHSLRNKRSKV